MVLSHFLHFSQYLCCRIALEILRKASGRNQAIWLADSEILNFEVSDFLSLVWSEGTSNSFFSKKIKCTEIRSLARVLTKDQVFALHAHTSASHSSVVWSQNWLVHCVVRVVKEILRPAAAFRATKIKSNYWHYSCEIHLFDPIRNVELFPLLLIRMLFPRKQSVENAK